MDEQDNLFTPESVDEQIERSSRAHNGQFLPPGTFLVQDLHRMYHSQSEESKRTLERAWTRIADHSSLPGQGAHPGYLQMPGSTPFGNRPKNVRSFQRRFNTIAAVVIACILVGSLLVVLNAVNQRKGQTAGDLTPIQHVATPAGTPTYKAGATIYTLHAQSAVHSVAWSPDGKRIASASNTIQVWDATTGAHVLAHKPSGPSLFVARWSPSGSYLASAAPLLEVWNATTGNTVVTCPKPIRPATDSSGHSDISDDEPLLAPLSWSPDGKYIALAYQNPAGPMVTVWDASTCKQVTFFNRENDVAYDVAWSPDGKYIAYATVDREVEVWDVVTHKLKYQYSDPFNTNIFHLAWSPDSKRIATTSYGSHTVEVWDATTGGNKVIYRNHSQPVTAIAWSPDGKYIASGSSLLQGASTVGEVQIWNPGTQQQLSTYRGNSHPVTSVTWSPDGKLIASADGDQTSGTVKVWAAI